MTKVTSSILKEAYKKRGLNAHKYDFGSLLVIGGSRMYSGSPAFAAMAAYKTGTDVVTVASPERCANIVASFSPEMITYPLRGYYLGPYHLKELFELAKNKSAVVIGGGLERRSETIVTVLSFLRGINIPCVIDADAIHAVARDKRVLNKSFVVTPHANEFQVLTGVKPDDKDLDKNISLVKRFAAQLNTVILLKGHVDIISDGKQVLLNHTGNPYMTKGGTGDVLAGIVGSLLAQGVEPLTAAAAAAYINGRAGDLAAKEKKQALLPSDLLGFMHKVF